MLVDLHIVLHWHRCKGYNPPTEAINSTNMCDSIHAQLFILIYMKFVSKITRAAWNWVQEPCCICLSVTACIHISDGHTVHAQQTEQTVYSIYIMWSVGTCSILQKELYRCCVPWKTAIHGCIRGSWSNK